MPIIKVSRRFRPNNTSARQAVTEISNLVPGSNVELSERSSVSPNTSKRPIRKKVASADRMLMLESFVNKYRSMNVGKFPSPTSAQKEVGGSYYIIRKMLQEMEYNVRISSEEKGLVKENKKLTQGEDIINREIVIESSGSQYESNSQVTINQPLCEDPSLESVSNFELKEGFQPSTSNADAGDSNVTRMPEQKPKDESHSGEKLVFEDSQSKVEKQHDGIRHNMRDMPEQQKDEGLREKPSLWGNLKSMATAFFNSWKK